MNYSIDWDGPGECDADECDHEDEDFDLVDCRAVCWTCGAVRSLTTYEMDQIIKSQFRDPGWH